MSRKTKKKNRVRQPEMDKVCTWNSEVKKRKPPGLRARGMWRRGNKKGMFHGGKKTSCLQEGPEEEKVSVRMDDRREKA